MENSFYNEEQRSVAARDKMDEYLMAAEMRFMDILIVVILIAAVSLLWFFRAQVAVGIDALTVANGGDIELYVLDTELNENFLFVEDKKPQTMTINGTECRLLSISQYPEEITAEEDSYKRYTGNFKIGDWYYTIHLKGDLPDGIAKNHVIIGWESPAALLFGR